jgi:CRISPR system Cascade subunit CasD
MSVLLLRLSGPMQSWGVQSDFTVRDTGLEPSKSGVVGLLCAALGRPRSAALDDLSALQMSVRVDQEGVFRMDYHTAGRDGLLQPDGVSYRSDLIVSRRYYLADARFLVSLQGDELLLRALDAALQRPVWPLYLGRKAFVPGEPVWLTDGLQPAWDLTHAMQHYPWLGSDERRYKQLSRLRIVRDDRDGTEERPDVPLSFAERRFAPRRVRSVFVDKPPMRPEAPCTSPA